MNPVYVNGRFKTQVLTGVQRYAWEVTRRLQRKLTVVEPKLALRRGTGHAWEQFVLPRLVGEHLLWSPAGSGPIGVRNQVVTIHDTAHLEYPEWYSRSFTLWYKWLWPQLVDNVSHIITVSEYSRGRIIDFLNVREEKVTSVPLGVTENFFNIQPSEVQRIKEKYRLPERYVLTVSAMSSRKNMERVLNAWSIASESLKDTYLVIVGKRGLAFADHTGSLEGMADRVIFTGYVSDSDLPFFYSGACCFIYVSLYEGFGLPILEAMAAETPVITSNVTAMPEVAENAAVLVCPFNVEDIASAIKRVVTDNALHQALIRRGVERAKMFSWDVTASKTWKLLCALVTK